jgi:hypothetical protein
MKFFLNEAKDKGSDGEQMPIPAKGFLSLDEG